MAGTTAIEVIDLEKRFADVTALDRVTFSVSRGQILGLLGPNGAGKTTIVNILSTLLRPDGGTARVDGHDVTSDPDAVRRSIALTGQFAAVDEVLTGTENLVLFGRLRGLTKAAASDRAAELLERFSLTSAADKPLSTYSGGMRRRLDLAASLVVPCPIVFLDEPTTGLDPRSRAELWLEVRQLKASGYTVVLTTQYLEEADQLADRIVVIDAGRVVAEGTSSELKDRVGGQALVLSLIDLAQQDAALDLLGGFGTPVVDEDSGAITLPGVGADRLSAAMELLAARQIGVAEASVRRPTLDEVFLQLTEAQS